MLLDKTLTYISLFSSAGVGCYGFKESGFECIVTNEIIERRLSIQKLNNKCKYNNGYICGDIKDIKIKENIFKQIDFYKTLGNDRVDVVIATPPCQGMSVANHKKRTNEIERNSLVVESVDLIHKIKPRFFIFENVASFYKTGCVDKHGRILSIGDMIEDNLSKDYSIYNKVVNFKNYGANSSRTRTLVIGVCKELHNYITGIELFPDYCHEKTLVSVISSLKPLKWGEYDKNDFFHSFRTYPINMREWIHDLKEGESAFENKDDKNKPHKILNGQVVVNTSKNGDKYKRQKWDSVAPCIHTRNDQLASQNTIHPRDDRVFSIRELMFLMNIPYNFKWINLSLEELNALNDIEKQKISKKHEMNIRQSIGEAVPTIIFRQIADKIKDFMGKHILNSKEITNLIEQYDLKKEEPLKEFIINNIDKISSACLSNLAEMADVKKIQNSAYFTNKFIINEIVKNLPNFNKKSITIIEPSVGNGNFLPFLFKKYEHIEQVYLKLLDINQNSLDILKLLYNNNIPKNFKLEYICADFIDYQINEHIDLVIGNPPFIKINKNQYQNLLQYSENLTNLAGMFLEKSMMIADHVSMIMPKNLLNTQDYIGTREKLYNKGVSSILDFGELGFSGVLIETINIITGKSKNIYVKSLPLGISLYQKASYIFDKQLPYWVIFRDRYFDSIFDNMNFGIFNAFRDRQITNSNSSLCQHEDDIRIVKSRNININGKIINIQGYDSYISKEKLYKLKISEFLDRDDVYLTPNMTYNPRIVKKEKGFIVNGSVAILIPKEQINLTEKQREYIASEEFKNFYKIARNYQTRTLNIDNTSCFWFGALKE